MRELGLARTGAEAQTILFLGAHCDDIEIGCGGTILRLREEQPEADLRWVILSSTPERGQEALESATSFLGPGGADRVTVEAFRDGFLPYAGAEVKAFHKTLRFRLFFSPADENQFAVRKTIRYFGESLDKIMVSLSLDESRYTDKEPVAMEPEAFSNVKPLL